MDWNVNIVYPIKNVNGRYYRTTFNLRKHILTGESYIYAYYIIILKYIDSII